MCVYFSFFSSHQVKIVSPALAGWLTGTWDHHQVVVHEVVETKATKEESLQFVFCPKDVPLSVVDMLENLVAKHESVVSRPTRTVWILQTSFWAWAPCACRCVDKIMTASLCPSTFYVWTVLKCHQSWCIHSYTSHLGLICFLSSGDSKTCHSDTSHIAVPSPFELASSKNGIHGMAVDMQCCGLEWRMA